MRVRPLTLAVLLAVGVDGPAAGTTSGDTTPTFTVAGGPLSITVPTGTVALGSGAPGTTISTQLGPVQVADARALLAGAWASSVTASSFTTGGGTTAETVAAGAVSYWSGPATAVSGTATFTPGQTTAEYAQTLDVSRTAYTMSAGVGDNSCTWNPWLVIAVPPQAVTGTYTGTVTHSVA